MRGILGGGTTQEAPTANIGLSGMRAPTSSAKPLIPTSPLIRPVKSPIGEAKPATATILPRPIKKLGTPDVTVNDEIAPEPMSNEISEFWRSKPYLKKNRVKPKSLKSKNTLH